MKSQKDSVKHEVIADLSLRSTEICVYVKGGTIDGVEGGILLNA